jgi:hypothetical protein
MNQIEQELKLYSSFLKFRDEYEDLHRDFPEILRLLENSISLRDLCSKLRNHIHKRVDLDRFLSKSVKYHRFIRFDMIEEISQAKTKLATTALKINALIDQYLNEEDLEDIDVENTKERLVSKHIIEVNHADSLIEGCNRSKNEYPFKEGMEFFVTDVDSRLKGRRSIQVKEINKVTYMSVRVRFICSGHETLLQLSKDGVWKSRRTAEITHKFVLQNDDLALLKENSNEKGKETV